MSAKSRASAQRTTGEICRPTEYEQCRVSRRGPSQNASKIVVDRVQVLGGRVHGPHLNDEAVANHPVTERCLHGVGPVPCEVDGFAVTRRDAGLLGRRKRYRQVFRRVSINELPKKITLRRAQICGGETDFLSVGTFASRVGKDVAKR